MSGQGQSRNSCKRESVNRFVRITAARCARRRQVFADAINVERFFFFIHTVSPTVTVGNSGELAGSFEQRVSNVSNCYLISGVFSESHSAAVPRRLALSPVRQQRVYSQTRLALHAHPVLSLNSTASWSARLGTLSRFFVRSPCVFPKKHFSSSKTREEGSIGRPRYSFHDRRSMLGGRTTNDPSCPCPETQQPRRTNNARWLQMTLGVSSS